MNRWAGFRPAQQFTKEKKEWPRLKKIVKLGLGLLNMIRKRWKFLMPILSRYLDLLDEAKRTNIADIEVIKVENPERNNECIKLKVHKNCNGV